MNFYRFSPRKSYLAAGSNDNAIDFYEVSLNENGTKLTRVSYCTQMPGSVLQMDWEISGEYLKVKIICEFSERKFYAHS